MAVEIDVVYQGDLRCTAKHGPSQTELTTDAPVDNHGKGQSFSPTDLVATALGSCILTTMGKRSRHIGTCGARFVNLTVVAIPIPSYINVSNRACNRRPTFRAWIQVVGDDAA